MHLLAPASLAPWPIPLAYGAISGLVNAIITAGAGVTTAAHGCARVHIVATI